MMGLTKLKIKDELRYRRGYTHSHCSDCNHYVGMTLENGLRDPRCRLIGLKPGRMYRVHPASVCDRFDGSLMLAKVKGVR